MIVGSAQRGDIFGAKSSDIAQGYTAPTEGLHYTKWTDVEGVDRYGCETIAETADFLNRAKQTGNKGEEPGDQDEIPF